MKNPDTLLVGFDNAHGDDAAVLIVGRKAPVELKCKHFISAAQNVAVR